MYSFQTFTEVKISSQTYYAYITMEIPLSSLHWETNSSKC